MARESVELVRRWIDAWNGGGFDAVIDAYWHDHIELLDPPDLPDSGRYTGKAAVRQRVESYMEFGWDGQFRVNELVDAGEEVVMPWTVVGRAPAGDMPIEFVAIFVLLIEEGVIRRIRWYMSEQEAREAAGLPE